MLPRGRPTLVVLSPAPSSFASSRSLLCLVLRRRRRLPRCLAALPCSRDFSHLFGVLRETPTQSPWTLQHISGPPVCKTKTKISLPVCRALLENHPSDSHSDHDSCAASTYNMYMSLLRSTLVSNTCTSTVGCWRWRGVPSDTRFGYIVTADDGITTGVCHVVLIGFDRLLRTPEH